MRILIVSQYFWPKSFRIKEVNKTLLEKDVEVEVLLRVAGIGDALFSQCVVDTDFLLELPKGGALARKQTNSFSVKNQVIDCSHAFAATVFPVK